MSINLKLDGRNKRGRCWKELTSCGKPVNQGAIISGKVCSSCNQSPDMEKQTVKCMKCNGLFHISCLLKPITEHDAIQIAENPCMWWFCLSCMSVKSGDSSSINMSPETTAIPSDVLLHRTLTTFKKDVLTLIGETIDRKLQESSVVTGERNAEVSSTGHSTSQGAWGNAIQPIIPFPSDGTTSDNSAALNNVSTPSNTPSEKHVLILDPNDSNAVNSDGFN